MAPKIMFFLMFIIGLVFFCVYNDVHVFFTYVYFFKMKVTFLLYGNSDSAVIGNY